MACSIYASTKQTTNAARVSRLLLDPCTDLLRDVLRHSIHEMSFPGKLQSETLIIKPLLNPSQRAMLYPKQGTFTGRYQDFDISLLYLLLRNISGITQHANGWGKTPNPNDRSISANVERIRNIRNTYIGHINQSSMSDSQFNSVWQEVRKIASELVKDVGLTTDYVGLIDRLEHETMDPALEQAYLQKLDDTELTVADLKGKQDKQTEIQRNQGQLLTKLGATLTEHEDRISKQGDVQTKQSSTLTEHQVRITKQGETQSKHGATLTEHGDQLTRQGEVQTQHGATLIQHEYRLIKQSEVQIKHGSTLTQHEELLTEQSCTLKEHEKRLNRQENIRDQEAEKILETSKEILLNHKSSRTYIRTGQVDSVKQRLLDQRIVLLTGRPGDGKSTAAKQVMCELSENNEYIPTIIHEPREWKKVVHSKQKMILHVDDMFGSTNLDIGAIDKWKPFFDLIQSSANKGKKLILITLRTSIIEKVRKLCHESFLIEPEFEFNLALNILTSKEKEKMLLQYAKVKTYKAGELIGEQFRKYQERHGNNSVYNLDEGEQYKIVKSEPYYGFPQTCFLFFARRDFFQLGAIFFLRPNRTLYENIDSMRKSNDVRTKLLYCTLAYVFLEGKINILRKKTYIFHEICKKSCLPKWTDVDVEDAVHDLEGLYLSPSNKMHVFKFCHVTILEAVAVSFGKLAPDIVIQKCRDEILVELIRTEGYEARDGEVILIIRKEYYPLLANRLLTKCRNKRYRRCIRYPCPAVEHPATDDAEFISVLFDVIIKSPHNSRTIIKAIWDNLKYPDKPVLHREILTRYGPHNIKHNAECDSDVSVDEHDSDTSVESEYESDIEIVAMHYSYTPVESGYDIDITVDVNYTPKKFEYDSDLSVDEHDSDTSLKYEYGSDLSVDEHDSDMSLKFKFDSEVSVDEHNSDMSVGRPYLITCKEVKDHLDHKLFIGQKQTVIVINEYVIKNCDVNYFLNSYNGMYCDIRGMSVLHCCVARGWTDVVNEILNVVTPTKTENNWSCLHFAAFFGRLELFKQFEKLSSNVLETTQEGYTILQVIELRLRHGMCRSDNVEYDLSESNTYSTFIRFFNISEPETDFVNLLQHVMAGYPSLIPSTDMPLDHYENNIIHYLVIHDREEIYDMFVNKKKELIFFRNNTRLPTTLHVAAYLGRMKFVEKLWKAGVRVNKTDLSIAECIENGQQHSDKTVEYIWKGRWLDQKCKVINNIKLKCITNQPVRFGCTEDYTAISSIYIADKKA